MKLMMFLLSMLLLANIASAASSSAAAAGAAAAAAGGAAAHRAQEERNAAFIAQQQASSCRPPEQFAEEYQCALKYDVYSKIVNRYICGPYTIQARCDGSIVGVQDNSLPPEMTKWFGIIILLVVGAVCAVILIRILIGMGSTS